MPDLLSKNLFKNKWYENDQAIWLLTTYEIRRNLKTHPFTHKLNSEYKNKMGEMLADSCKTHPLLKNALCCASSELLPEEKQLLFEYFLPSSDFSKYHSGELFIVEPSHPFYVGIHLEDHLTFYWVDTQKELEENWTKALEFEGQLSKNLEFAFNANFGFLTANPKKCGIALTLSIFLHLPALIHLNAIEDTLQNINANFFDIQNLGGSIQQPLADLLIIRNLHSLGLSEETLLKSMRRLAVELSLDEQKKRKNLSENEIRTLKDKIGKAYGMLQHASRLSLEEAFSNLSLCKLGLELKWLSGISPKEMNCLFFTLRKALISNYKGYSSSQSTEEFRAQFIKIALKKTKFSN